jgi:hypothetical protein
MGELQERQEVEERLGAVERRSHHLMLAGIAVAGMAAAAWFVWRARHRKAASLAAPVRRKRTRLRAVPGPGRPSARRSGTKKTGPRRKLTE